MSNFWSNLKFYGRCICIACREWLLRLTGKETGKR